MRKKRTIMNKNLEILSKTYDFNGNLKFITVNLDKDTFNLTSIEYLNLIAQGFVFTENENLSEIHTTEL